MHRWWVKREDRAGLTHRPMHEAHTSDLETALKALNEDPT
jgi:hypothetical protein